MVQALPGLPIYCPSDPISNFQQFADMAASPAARSERKSDRKSTTYDPNFEQLLLYYGSYADFNSGRLPKPVNWNYLKNMLRQNPVECAMEDFESFVEKANDIRGETKTIHLLLPLILGDENIPHEQNIPFSNFQPLIDGLVDGKPDFFDGLRASDVQVDIRTSLGHFIVPSKMPGIPVLPNFFLEAKGSDGSPAVVKRQILHDGTLGARAMHTLLAWSRPEESFDDIARTISATFQDGFLQLYTTHCSFQDRKMYYTNLLDIYPLKKSLESFQEGITAIRNARKWAMTERESMISEINNAAIPHTVQIPRDSRHDRHHTPHSLATTSVTVDSQSTDELARPGVTTKKRGSKSATPRKGRGVQKRTKKQRK